ncbi:MAG: hypothetical protein FJ109_03530 [Deltaproteobacteria bacterium]|nr:hypothetical protein [Deltaproteobacteria bacterium]
MRGSRTSTFHSWLAALLALSCLGGQSGFGVCLSLQHEAHVVPLGACHDHDGIVLTHDAPGEPHERLPIRHGGHFHEIEHHESSPESCAGEGCCIDLPLPHNVDLPRRAGLIFRPVQSVAAHFALAAPAAEPCVALRFQRLVVPPGPPGSGRLIPLRI